MLVRQWAQALASDIRSDDRDGASRLRADHTVVRGAIRLGTGRDADRGTGSQELVRNRAACASAGRRDKLVAALAGARRRTVVGQVAVDHASSRSAGNALRTVRATQSQQGGKANRRISREIADFAGDDGALRGGRGAIL